MNLFASRFATGKESTASHVWRRPDDGWDEKRLCYFLEDQYQEGKKVPGETCIPTGIYELELVHDSDMARRYYERFDWFRGLPTLLNVPGFTHIRIHPGNDDDDTEGCPLTGSELVDLGGGDHEARLSVEAFRVFCEAVYAALLDRRERVFLEISDHEIRL